jgi:hypothetical protein
MKYIIITSIFPLTKAVKAFAEKKDYITIVVGDNKTPEPYFVNDIRYLSVKTQSELGYELNKELPYNHYCRKNIGYIFAIREGAEVIIDSDDDNIPYPDWSFPDFEGKYEFMDLPGFVNIYEVFTDQNIWPRGLPLNEVRTGLFNYFHRFESCNVGIWQGLADGDPDVDAIYRLLSNCPCKFNKREPIVLSRGTITPFNSQNTAFRKELFPLLYLPGTVSFRFTDILRGYISQPIMWLYGYLLGVTKATVYQERNPHDLMKDFEQEIPMYLHSANIIDIVSKVISSEYSITENLYLSYEELFRRGIVEKHELTLVEAWIKDLKGC